jgi:hypothetical protein
MGTQVPRIQVTLKPDTYAVVSRIAELTKGSKSRLISELVDEVVPHLESMIRLLVSAATVKAEHREQVAADAQTLLDLMLPHAEDAHAAFDRMASVLTPESEAGPPSSNTGVTKGVKGSNRSKKANVQ